MITVQMNSDKPINPHVLVEGIVPFSSSKEINLRVALLTADNKPLPYFLVQIYETTPAIRYILNFALYPDKSVYDTVKGGTLTSSDFILASLSRNHTDGIKVYRIDNGKQFTDALFANQTVIDKMICSKIDDVMKAWMVE